jgi:hypothetical protein
VSDRSERVCGAPENLRVLKMAREKDSGERERREEMAPKNEATREEPRKPPGEVWV